jgi:PAS domain S-box-containing protein
MISRQKVSLISWCVPVVLVLLFGWFYQVILPPLIMLVAITAVGWFNYSYTQKSLLKPLEQQIEQLNTQLADKTTRLTRSETTTEQARNRLQAMVNGMSSAIVVVNEQGIIGSINPEAYDLFGLDEMGLLGRKITDFLPKLKINGKLFGQILNSRVNIELDVNCLDKVKPVELNCSELLSAELATGRRFMLLINDISVHRKNEQRISQLNQRLINTSRQAGMAEIATYILHTIGNVLNSINTSVSVLQQRTGENPPKKLNDVAKMLEEEGVKLFEQGGKSKLLIEYLEAFAAQLEKANGAQISELGLLKQHVSHIADIVSAQQKFSGTSGIIEKLDVSQMVEEALKINVVLLEDNQVQVIRHFPQRCEIMGDRSRIMQILVNLVGNGSEAMIGCEPGNALMTITITLSEYTLVIDVQDSGHGIDLQTMKSMFRYGFTTKQGGHGIGLHSCALVAKKMDGELTIQSEGFNKGTNFKLTLPADLANREAYVMEKLTKQDHHD